LPENDLLAALEFQYACIDLHLGGSEQLHRSLAVKRQLVTATTLLALLMSMGCVSPLFYDLDIELGDESPGELGQAMFSYRSGKCFLFGCGLDSPLMTGTTETLSVWGPGISSFALLEEGVVEILEVDLGTKGRALEVSALAPGSAILQVLDDSNAVIDQSTLVVADAVTLELKWDLARDPEQTTGPFSIAIGERGFLELSAFDTESRELYASTAIYLQLPDLETLTLGEMIGSGSGLARVAQPFASVNPVASGETTLHMSAYSGLSRDFVIQVSP
jgi:hypothetical protein